jgi:hypothetical protein
MVVIDHYCREALPIRLAKCFGMSWAWAWKGLAEVELLQRPDL